MDRLALVTPFDRLATVAQAHLPWSPVRWLLRESYDVAGAAVRLRMPVPVAVAGHDAVVPAASTQALTDALPQQPRVITAADATDDAIVAAPAFERALQDFFDPPMPRCTASGAPVPPASR